MPVPRRERVAEATTSRDAALTAIGGRPDCTARLPASERGRGDAMPREAGKQTRQLQCRSAASAHSQHDPRLVRSAVRRCLTGNGDRVTENAGERDGRRGPRRPGDVRKCFRQRVRKIDAGRAGIPHDSPAASTRVTALTECRYAELRRKERLRSAARAELRPGGRWAGGGLVRRAARRPARANPPCGGASSRFELVAGHLVVVAAAGDQLLVRPLLHDPAGVHHEDLVAVDHGAKPVADQDDRPLALERAQRLGDQLLVMRVQGAGRLVEHEERRLGQQRPGDGEALPLAAGEVLAALGDSVS